MTNVRLYACASLRTCMQCTTCMCVRMCPCALGEAVRMRIVVGGGGVH